MRKTNKKFRQIVKKGTVIACASTMILSNASLIFAADTLGKSVNIQNERAAENAGGITLSDNSVLQEGTYQVPVRMRQLAALGKDSMAAGSMENSATLVVADGEAFITLTFKTVNVMMCDGNLDVMKYFNSRDDAIKANSFEIGNATEIVSYRNDGKYSEFGGANLQENLKKPKDIRFKVPYTDNNYVYVSMQVDIMTALGMSSTEAAIEIDYANAVEIVKKENLEDKLTEAKGYVNDNYTSESLTALNAAINQAEAVNTDTSSTQKQVDAQITALNKAIQKMTYKAADYTLVDAAIAKVPADLSVYTSASATEVKNAIANVNRDKNILEQDQVNAMASKINTAVEALVKADTVGTETSKKELDKDNLENGTYQTSVYLWNAALDKESMAASSILKNAKIVVKDGVYRMYINTTEMTFGNITASLQELKIYQLDGTVANAVVEKRDENGNPTCFSFILPSTEEFVKVAVNPHVAMMGNTDIDARLKIDYSSLEYVNESVSQPDDTKQDNQDAEGSTNEKTEGTLADNNATEESSTEESKVTAPKTGDRKSTAGISAILSATTLAYLFMKKSRTH